MQYRWSEAESTLTTLCAKFTGRAAEIVLELVCSGLVSCQRRRFRCHQGITAADLFTDTVSSGSNDLFHLILAH